LASLLAGLGHAPAAPAVRVEAGASDRTGLRVTFPLPETAPRPNAIVIDGRLQPLQFRPGHRSASFLAGRLPQGSQAVYALTNTPSVPGAAGWMTLTQNTRFAFRPASSSPAVPLLEYQAEPGPLPRPGIPDLYQRGGYLHPVRTLSGRVVTDDFPANHLHHHGVWWSWTKTSFDGRQPDFWNMGQGKGRVDFLGLDAAWAGPVEAGFASRHRFIDLTRGNPVPVLEETWEVTAGVAGAVWWFDLVSTQRCSGPLPLRLPQYHYGGLGLRGPMGWNGAANARFLTSEGTTNRVTAHAQRSRWCDVSGLVDGRLAGLAVLGHPDNYRAPQPMRIHPDEPFFCYAPQQLGDMAIQPGEEYVSRYRFVVHDGAITPAELERFWQDFARPAAVTVLFAR
jgi:hypothetical protein